MASTAAYEAQRYQQAKADGICVKHGCGQPAIRVRGKQLVHCASHRKSWKRRPKTHTGPRIKAQPVESGGLPDWVTSKFGRPDNEGLLNRNVRGRFLTDAQIIKMNEDEKERERLLIENAEERARQRARERRSVR